MSYCALRGYHGVLLTCSNCGTWAWLGAMGVRKFLLPYNVVLFSQPMLHKVYPTYLYQYHLSFNPIASQPAHSTRSMALGSKMIMLTEVGTNAQPAKHKHALPQRWRQLSSFKLSKMLLLSRRPVKLINIWQYLGCSFM